MGPQPQTLENLLDLSGQGPALAPELVKSQETC